MQPPKIKTKRKTPLTQNSVWAEFTDGTEGYNGKLNVSKKYLYIIAKSGQMCICTIYTYVCVLKIELKI